MKRLVITVSAITVLIASFVMWATANGLVVLVVSSPEHSLKRGWIHLPGREKSMVSVAGRLFGAYTVEADRDISLKVDVNGTPRDITFGYATPGEFQINTIEVNSSGEVTVGHHTVP